MVEPSPIARQLLQRLPSSGYLAFVGADGQAEAVPVTWSLPGQHGAPWLVEPMPLGEGMPSPGPGQRVVLVIHRASPSPRWEGIRVDGRVQQAMHGGAAVTLGPESIRTWRSDRDGPHRAEVAWDRQAGPPASDRDPLAGQLQAVIRIADYDPALVGAAPDRIQRFERVHQRQAGYAGNVVVDLGGGRRCMLTLWRTRRHAAAAREALGPVVRRLLAPLERSPSRLLGVGGVLTTDLVLSAPSGEPEPTGSTTS